VLLAVPNFSEGRDLELVEAVTAAFAAGAELLDRHTDPVHNRTVLTLTAQSKQMAPALTAGAATCIDRLDLAVHDGAHPRIGALDVCPVVYVDDADRESAREAAQAVAEAIADLGVPVFLYGELASTAERRERAFFRRGGPSALGQRMAEGLRPDLGPPELHPTAGATLVTARPPLAAFNLLLDTGEIEIAVAVAAKLRESGGGTPGVRAMAVDLDGRAQVSTNVHDPVAVPLAHVIERVRQLAAEHGVRPVEAELVGLVPEAAIAGLPADVPIPGFDPERQVIERRLAALS
jgi:glutamate formiminotransferase / 5-formyltetrahydrofolate cyclo-ligase